MASQYESEKDGKFPEQKGFIGMQMVQFKCPRHRNFSVSSIFGIGRLPFYAWPGKFGNVKKFREIMSNSCECKAHKDSTF